DGTDGVLGWGRPWNVRPKALKLWVKYSPVTVDYDNSDYSDLKKGDMDNGKIYIALLTDDKVTATDSKGNKYGDWPVVVRTKSSQRSLFSKDDANVIGYGEMVFTEATGNNMIQVTIPIDYRSDAPVKNIMMVAAASMGGDYFTGGNGSTMWLDDLELVY
ncbi:MAG: PCMD domain-containing protein, partial [Duncaniella sp.]|nr:PCMD domain-containing protein [Duncaniella sp.]